MLDMNTDQIKEAKIKAVIFDLDGTLVDSEPNYLEADKRLLAEYGILNLDEESKNKYIGISTKDMMADIKEIYQIEDSVETLVSKNNGYYSELAKDNTNVFPEMKNLLILLKEKGYPIALASGSSKKIINDVLSLIQISEIFDVIVSAEEVREGKPKPDIFLEAAKRLGLSPENCLVLEDSKPGVEAAKSAGMYCVAVPYYSEQIVCEGLKKADVLVNGMGNFSSKKIYEWMKAIY